MCRHYQFLIESIYKKKKTEATSRDGGRYGSIGSDRSICYVSESQGVNTGGNKKFFPFRDLFLGRRSLFWFLSRNKSVPGVTLTTHPYLAPRLGLSRTITLFPFVPGKHVTERQTVARELHVPTTNLDAPTC
jgi:hypothetical protein